MSALVLGCRVVEAAVVVVSIAVVVATAVVLAMVVVVGFTFCAVYNASISLGEKLSRAF